MKIGKGTPKNINGAVVNALSEAFPGRVFTESSPEVIVVLEHIQERLSQDFNYAILNAGMMAMTPMGAIAGPHCEKAVDDLFTKIFPNRKKTVVA